MATTQSKNTSEISRGYPYRGKLVAMPSTSRILRDPNNKVLWGSADKQGWAVEFPAMPDTIELARSAEYMVVSSPMLPDGYHQYVSTKPLEIPVSFRLHAFDNTYCKQGALTLLQIAARLHAFVLPISTEKVLAQPASINRKSGQVEESVSEANADEGSYGWSTYGDATGESSSIYPPVTCWLHLIWTDENMPGISCVGYVKDVRAVLHGPFLKGPGGSFNLPSAAEFSFTFVHRPGHNNAFGQTSSTQKPQPGAQTSAYATDVRDGFYNTRHLVYVANYKGLDDGVTETEANQQAIQDSIKPIENIIARQPRQPVPVTTQSQIRSLFPVSSPLTGRPAKAPGQQ